VGLGLPIISTVDGEVREIVEKNQVGVFAGAENPQGLAEAIERVRSFSDQEREEIKRRGREYIDREGDRKKLAHRFYNILKELVNRK
jgi:glycosyltransferase involved in cell wall biosynthesis